MLILQDIKKEGLKVWISALHSPVSVSAVPMPLTDEGRKEQRRGYPSLSSKKVRKWGKGRGEGLGEGGGGRERVCV